MRSVAIVLDGVLRKPLDREAQDTGGALLYAGLLSTFRMVVLGGPDKESDEQFLMLQGLRKYVKLEPTHPEDEPYLRKGQLRRLRAEGFRFEFVVVPDPDLGLELLADGFPVLVYTHPQFSPPEARELQPWIELADRVDFEVRTRAESSSEA